MAKILESGFGGGGSEVGIMNANILKRQLLILFPLILSLGYRIPRIFHNGFHYHGFFITNLPDIHGFFITDFMVTDFSLRISFPRKKLDISAYRKNLDLTLGEKGAVVVFALQFCNVEMVKLLDCSLVINSSQLEISGWTCR